MHSKKISILFIICIVVFANKIYADVKLAEPILRDT